MPTSRTLRRALCQVHLWLGIALGVYILAICISGSVLVFRRDIDRALCPTLCEPAFVTWLADLHDYLLLGRRALWVNGIFAIAVVLLCATGIVIWSSAKGRWWHRMSLRSGVTGRRFLWDLHNALGIWVVLFVLLWALTGIYFAFPDTFYGVVSDDALYSISRLHFGRAFGWPIKVTWAVLGLAPCALFVTGTLTWLMRHRSANRSPAE